MTLACFATQTLKSAPSQLQRPPTGDPDSKKDRNLACEGKLKCVDGKCKGDKLGKGEGPCVTSADCESDDLKCDDKTSKCVSEVKQPFPPKTVLPDNAKLQLWLGLNKDAFHIPDLECDGDEGYLVRRTKVDIYYDGDANTQYQCKDTILEECRADWDLVTAASEIKFGGKRGEWGPSSELSTTTMGTKANHPAYKDPYFTITKITKTCTAKCKEERQNKKCCSCTYSVEDSMFKESSPGFGTAGDQSVSYKGNLVDYIEVNVGDKDESGYIVVSVLGSSSQAQRKGASERFGRARTKSTVPSTWSSRASFQQSRASALRSSRRKHTIERASLAAIIGFRIPLRS